MEVDQSNKNGYQLTTLQSAKNDVLSMSCVNSNNILAQFVIEKLDLLMISQGFVKIQKNESNKQQNNNSSTNKFSQFYLYQSKRFKQQIQVHVIYIPLISIILNCNAFLSVVKTEKDNEEPEHERVKNEDKNNDKPKQEPDSRIIKEEQQTELNQEPKQQQRSEPKKEDKQMESQLQLGKTFSYQFNLGKSTQHQILDYFKWKFIYEIKNYLNIGLNEMPIEIKLKLIYMLPAKSLLRLAQVNKEWNELIENEDDSLWENLYMKTYKQRAYEIAKKRKTNLSDWKEIFQKKYHREMTFRNVKFSHMFPFVF